MQSGLAVSRSSSRPDDAKNRYRALCASQPGMPIFDRDWWLDAVCGGAEHWDVLLVERGGEIVASMPYVKRKKALFQMISMPPLTLTLGVWIRYPDGLSAADKLSLERDIYTALIDGLPQVDYFKQQLHGDNTNWSVFYWHGFRQTSRFTYMLADTSDPLHIISGFSEHVRSDLLAAQERVRVVWDADVERFQDINRLMFDPPHFPMPYSFETLRAVDQACGARGCRQILLAEDEHGQVLCGLYLLWDDRCTYYFLGGETPRSKGTGAHSLLVWHAIMEAARRGQPFDFHGGMHEPIERMCRSFGATQTSYSQISKVSGRLFKLIYYLKQALH